MITKINDIRVPKDDPMHGLCGDALEARINEFAREVRMKQQALYDLVVTLTEGCEPPTRPWGFWRRLVATLFSLAGK